MNYQNEVFPTRLNESDSDKLLFRNCLIRWQALTHAEKFVCVAIVIYPLWWTISWVYSPLILTIYLFGYQIYRHKTLGLSRPSLAVVALILPTIYSTILYRFNVPDS